MTTDFELSREILQRHTNRIIATSVGLIQHGPGEAQTVVAAKEIVDIVSELQGAVVDMKFTIPLEMMVNTSMLHAVACITEMDFERAYIFFAMARCLIRTYSQDE